MDISQKYIDSLLETISSDLLNKKKTALDSLDTSVQSLCTEVETKLSRAVFFLVRRSLEIVSNKLLIYF